MLLKANGEKNKKSCGILLAVSSLPSDYGIGSLGKEAYQFVDFLSKTNQNFWQILPLCPIGKGNSPYCSVSSFAGEILLIDIEVLVNCGLLNKSDIPQANFTKNTDYKSVRKFKLPLLKKAAENFDIRNKDYKKFEKENCYWLEDFALFMAIKDSFGECEFRKLPEEYKYRFPKSLEYFKLTHTEEILFYKITQYFFFCQYKNLKSYANKAGIKIIGDIPFYVSLDSADVWSNPECFKLGRDLTPVLVAGVPPDIFSETGQLWGNPIYDWEYQRKTNYDWWRKRLRHSANLYDVIRIDHFRAFADYYTIPYGASDAKSGKWEKGVGLAFWKTIIGDIENTEIIAEDLGGETAEVRKLICDTGFPNMKVLQFAFDSDLKNQFLPKNFEKNCFCYTGTHDNDTTLGWYNNATKKERLLFSRLVPRDQSGSVVLSLILYGMKSRAKTVIIPFQDYLRLTSKDRMNTPGSEFGNWEWRFEKKDISDELVKTVLRLSKERK